LVREEGGSRKRLPDSKKRPSVGCFKEGQVRGKKDHLKKKRQYGIAPLVRGREKGAKPKRGDGKPRASWF